MDNNVSEHKFLKFDPSVFELKGIKLYEAFWYIDLIQLACRNDCLEIRSNCVLTKSKGNVYISQIDLAKRWKTTRNKVSLVLDRLSCFGLISKISNGKAGSVIKINDFEELC